MTRELESIPVSAVEELVPPPSTSEIDAEVASLRRQVAQEMYSRRHTAGIQLNIGDIDEEYVPDLKTITGRMKVFDRMANDPRVRAQLRAITMTIMSGVRWKVVGGTARSRALIESNLLRRGPRRYWMRTSWLDFLMQSLGMLIHGFAPFGVSWANPIDGRQLVSELTWLHPRSIDEDGWVMDEFDRLIAIRRSYQDATGGSHAREPTSISDIFLMCWDRRGPNWEGNAFIRPMYRPWVLGEMAEKIDMIDLQNRGVGIPVAKLSGAGGIKERNTLIEILKSLRGGDKSRAFIVLEKEEEVKYLLSEGQSKNAEPILRHHGTNITKSGGTEYFDQGETKSGSRAGASALATGFFVNTDGIRVVLQDQINYGAGPLPGLVERIVERNYGPDEEPPEIQGSRVSPTEQLDNIPLVQEGIAKGAYPRSRKIANEMLDRLGWGDVDFTEDEWNEAIERDNQKSLLGPGSPALGGPGRPNEPGDDDRGRDDRDSQRLKLSRAQKKTLDASQLPSNPRSWHWLESTKA